MPAMEFEERKWRDREALRQIISQWNANRLDLFSLSEPNEEFEFHGVMRFYFQDAGQKIATKCIRVSSTASTQAVIETLIEKFRPDMKMLHMTEYALYEIHPNGEERCLGTGEKPLLVQLNWHKDDREGRFLLRRADEKSTLPATQPPEESSFRRKLSKREKRNMKKENKLRKMKSSADHPDDDAHANNGNESGGPNGNNKGGSVAEKLYTELPETSFTRSISNPEAVMRRRRQQKLERKLQLFRSKDGGPDTGGTLKIYGESLCRDVPYKTLLLSVRETAAYVVREMLDKYGLNREDPAGYCLVQVTSPPPGSAHNEPPQEYILEDDECPLSILMNLQPGTGPVMFHVRRRPADNNSAQAQARRRKKKLSGSGGSLGGGSIHGGGGGGSSSGSLMGRPPSGHHPGGGSMMGADGSLHSPDDPAGLMPYLVELNPDGSEVRQGGAVRRYVLAAAVTEVGSERPAPPHPSSPVAVPSIQLFGPGIQPRHCVLASTEGMVTLTPCSPQAETYVNGQRLAETTLLQAGCVVRFGRNPVHQFRFVDPAHEFRTPAASTALNYERFNTGGGPPVGTRPPAPPGNPQQGQVQGTDPILPAVLELPEEVEDAFLHALIPNLDTRSIVFRLSPCYSLYLMARYRASTHFRPELNPMERAQRLTLTLSRVGAMMQAIVQERYADPPSLAFWMANASELLHFLKSDRHICAFSLDGQDLLAEAVQIAFRNASVCLTSELLQSMPPMLSPPDEMDDEAATAQVLSVLSSTMGLLRRCRVNAALTIQLFSQLFHALNAALFNRLVGVDSPRLPVSASHHLLPPPGANLCSRQWGIALSKRLRRLEAWAERQGLELAADCHLARVMQAAHLLQSAKNTAEQLVEQCASCFKLNSLQLKALLERYRPSPEEPPIPPQLVRHIVHVAEGTADELQLADGRPLRLDEDSQLAVPFLLPDDGYSCDVMRGIPTGLMEVLAPLQQAGLCRLTPQPTSSGLWTIYMGEPGPPVVVQQQQQQPVGPQPPRAPSAAGGEPPFQPQPIQQQPELQLLMLRKASDSMGLSIVAARGTGQQQLGIYIKSVVKGGSADLDGRLQAGDQLLSVDGYSLVGITQDRAAEILMRTGPTVRLEVLKQAAMFHGLATLLAQPSPTSTVNRSTLSLNKIDSQQQQQRLRSAPQQQPPQQQPYQERLVDWDRPATSNRINSNSSPSLASQGGGDQMMMMPPQGRPLSSTGAQLQQQQMQQQQQQLRNANSRSVPALHPPPHGPLGAQQQPHPDMMAYQQHQQQMLAQQRAQSTQQLQQQRYGPGQPMMMMPPPMAEPTSPTRLTAQQQQAATRSRSVQNLASEAHRPALLDAQQRQSSVRARHPSNPSMEDERQYQNIGQYQQQQQQQQQRGLLSPVGNKPPGQPTVQHLRGQSVVHQQPADSPPPPPPPPVSTHPLLAGQAQQAVLATAGQTPWEREELERQNNQRRQEAARQWMEEQIGELEALGPANRTPKQEEQLRSLRLEYEFRKRAMEAAQEEEEGEEEDSGALQGQGMLRLVQEDLERARQWRMEKEQQQARPAQQQMQQPPPQQQQQQQAPPPSSNGVGSMNNNNTAAVPDQERARKIEAFQRKQRELEATQAAEERILREAQRRKQQEDDRQQSQQQWSSNRPSSSGSNSAPSQRLDNLLVSGGQDAPQTSTNSGPTKRVSFFQEPTSNNDTRGQQREDHEAFILQAEEMLSNHTPPRMGGGNAQQPADPLLLTGSTPGVIGAQEVYRDPRARRLAEQQQQQQKTTQLKTGPEKLSFQEKMRMFALESGEPATPQEKSKISKAQREIELKPSPATTAINK